MLANSSDTPAQFGSLDREVHVPATFRHGLIEFIGDELPAWRDRSDRPHETSETILTSQLCAHLNSVARHSAGWDILQFRVEEADAENKGRKIDLIASSCGASICIEGRKHTEFETLLPVECKRLPIPSGKDRDEREYVISAHSSTGGIQRFKAGHHGSIHSMGAMIAYIQNDSIVTWDGRIAAWIRALAESKSGWSQEDLLHLERNNQSTRAAFLRSTHVRADGRPEIKLSHLWIEMN
jgi:hypothetical protein